MPTLMPAVPVTMVSVTKCPRANRNENSVMVCRPRLLGVRAYTTLTTPASNVQLANMRENSGVAGRECVCVCGRECD